MSSNRNESNINSVYDKSLTKLLINTDEKKKKLQSIRDSKATATDSELTKITYLQNGKKRIVKLSHSIVSYFDLQFEVAKFSSVKAASIVEYESTSQMVTPANFRSENSYVVREIPNREIESINFLPLLPFDWEYTKYQGKPN